MHLKLDVHDNRLHIDKMWAIFIGQFSDNVMHRHYALQICLSSDKNMKITDGGHVEHFYTRLLINSNVPHQFQSDTTCLILLVNPISALGYHLAEKYRHQKIVHLTQDFSQISNLFYSYIDSQLQFKDFVQQIQTYLNQFQCENHLSDIRIYNAIQYLEREFERIVSLAEIAGICNLSQTRFLHLFKEKTNLNFRRYQLWNKLIKSLPYLKGHTITEAAHHFGFVDSSHYTRTFKETFGLSPKIFKNIK